MARHLGVRTEEPEATPASPRLPKHHASKRATAGSASDRASRPARWRGPRRV
jgi:hypothetical protein